MSGGRERCVFSCELSWCVTSVTRVAGHRFGAGKGGTESALACALRLFRLSTRCPRTFPATADIAAAIIMPNGCGITAVATAAAAGAVSFTTSFALSFSAGVASGSNRAHPAIIVTAKWMTSRMVQPAMKPRMPGRFLFCTLHLSGLGDDDVDAELGHEPGDKSRDDGRGHGPEELAELCAAHGANLACPPTSADMPCSLVLKRIL